MKKDREEGYYWIMIRGLWEVGAYTGDEDWEVCGREAYVDEDDLQKVGPKITQYKEP